MFALTEKKEEERESLIVKRTMSCHRTRDASQVEEAAAADLIASNAVLFVFSFVIFFRSRFFT